MAFVLSKPWRPAVLGLLMVTTLGACSPSSDSIAPPSDATASEEVTGSAPSPGTPTPDSEPPQSTETKPAEPPAGDTAAEVAAVEASPVKVKIADQSQEQDAAVGMALAYGDTIRTAESGLAQIDLANGLAFRIGGEASLTLQPNQQLQLDSGEMLVWVEPGQQVPTEIVTPVGVAGLRGTTLFVQVPENSDEGVIFFSWEGEIRLRFPGDSEDLILNAGEELQVRPGERLADLRGKVQRLRRRAIRQRRQQSRLLNGFERPLPTQSQLEQTIEAAPAGP
ncbi:MAG: FecR domain-containing protein [Leptolyngbyaceae cyanobacterium]